MKIVVNEMSEVKRILKHGFSKKYINLYEVGLLAKYFYSLGYKRRKIEQELLAFCKKYNTDFNEILHADIIKKAIDSTKKFGLRDRVGSIPVTAAELDAIRFLPHKYYKVLFFILVLAKVEKYNKARIVPRPEQLGYFLNHDLYSILRESGLRVTKDEANKIKHIFDGELRLISASLLSDKKWKVLFANDRSPTVLVVEDVENTFAYMPYFCVQCGAQISKKSKMHDLCDSCYKEDRKKRNRMSAKEYYKKNKTG